jgi:hypothetical protein
MFNIHEARTRKQIDSESITDEATQKLLNKMSIQVMNVMHTKFAPIDLMKLFQMMARYLQKKSGNWRKNYKRNWQLIQWLLF